MKHGRRPNPKLRYLGVSKDQHDYLLLSLSLLGRVFELLEKLIDIRWETVIRLGIKSELVSFESNLVDYISLACHPSTTYIHLVNEESRREEIFELCGRNSILFWLSVAKTMNSLLFSCASYYIPVGIRFTYYCSVRMFSVRGSPYRHMTHVFCRTNTYTLALKWHISRDTRDGIMYNWSRYLQR